MNDTSPAVPEPTLAELAKQANLHHLQAMRQVEIVRRGQAAGISHALQAGDALEAASRLVQAGDWYRWVEANIEYSVHTVKKYRRMAEYRAEIEAAVEAGTIRTIEESWDVIVGLPPRPTGQEKPAAVKAKALEMHAEGRNPTEIAQAVGVSWGTVKEWTDPEYKAQVLARQRVQAKRRKAALKALARQEKLDQAKARKDPTGEAYVLVRNLLIQLDAASSDDAEVRQLLTDARTAARSVERKVWKAVQLS